MQLRVVARVAFDANHHEGVDHHLVDHDLDGAPHAGADYDARVDHHDPGHRAADHSADHAGDDTATTGSADGLARCRRG